MNRGLLFGAFNVFVCCTLVCFAQEGAKPGAKPAAAATNAEGKPKGRLPANFGKLGLSDAQKTSIYGVQAKYESQLEALEKQIAELKSQREKEVEALLNADQRSILARLKKEVEEKRAKAKESAATPAATPAAAPATDAAKK